MTCSTISAAAFGCFLAQPSISRMKAPTVCPALPVSAGGVVQAGIHLVGCGLQVFHERAPMPRVGN